MKSTFSRWLAAIAREHDLKTTLNKDNLSNWLPDVARNHGRKAVLGVAGLAFVGAGIAGPTTAAFAGSDVPATQTTASAATKIQPVAQTTPIAPAPPGGKALNYDYMRQPNFYYCGPAATRIALTAIGHAPSQDDVAKKLGTTTDGTKSAAETTRALNSIAGGNVYKTHEIPGKTATGPQMDQLRTDVVQAVSTGRAVVANIAGTVTDNSGNVHSYEGGHYLTVVGYDQGGMVVKIADPADDKGDGSYWLPVGTMANWIATRGYSA
jgi:hypothetical protein